MKQIKLQDLGYTQKLEDYRKSQSLENFEVARVIAEHKERYWVKNKNGEYEAEIIGNLRYSAQSRADFPAVGDWVATSEYDEGKMLIHSIFPRKGVIERQVVGKTGEKQIIASNVDVAFIVMSIDRDFNMNRVERYLSICNAAKVKPILLVSKTDLLQSDEVIKIANGVQNRFKDLQSHLFSNLIKDTVDLIENIIKPGLTYCFIGSSGVGKSTLINNLAKGSSMKTGDISESTQRGKHITTHRELIITNNGGILIDNPGMREVGITENKEGMEMTFSKISELSENCRFKDCRHINESGCAVIEALENGSLDQSSYENFLKLEREKAHFESSLLERRKKDKQFGKMVKQVMKNKKNNKH